MGVSACNAPDSEVPSAITVDDSLGVRVVTHPAGPFRDTVPLEPVLSIGQEGDPDYEFFSVRQVSPLRSRSIVVANGGTSELMLYGPEGEFRTRVGRRGEGPSEFGFLTTVYTRTGDTLIVMDPQRRRLVHFDSAGTFVRDESFAEDLTSDSPTSTCFFPGLMGLLADGTRFTRGWGCIELTGTDGIPFGPVVAWTTGPDRLYLSQGVDYSVLVYDSTAWTPRPGKAASSACTSPSPTASARSDRTAPWGRSWTGSRP
jgi:hypothetical protein